MEVRLYATLRQIAKTRSVELMTSPGDTIGDVLHSLVERFPALTPSVFHEDGTLAGHVAVILEGRDIRHLDGVKTPLDHAERVDIFPPVGGG